jgi:two-component system sensor histidine kinase VicK
MFDNYENQSQFNTVVPSQKEMDRVGFEPTTSAAHQQLSRMSDTVLLILVMHDCKLAITLLSRNAKLRQLWGIEAGKMSSSSDTNGEAPAAILPEEEEKNYDPKVHAASPEYEEKTEVIYGEENVVKWALQTLSTVTKSLDMCGDRYGPSILLLNDQIRQMYIDLHNKGVRERNVTEITPENIIHCKKLMQFQELRHLDGLKGYFGLVDGRLANSHAFGQEGKTLSHVVVSTVRVFVEQQQYLFETLWNKAIPAKQRIKEIEQGAKREFVETIRDPYEIQKIGFDLIKKAEEEILLLFSTANAFSRQEKAGVLELLKEAASPPRSVRIRILIPTDWTDNNRMEQGKLKVTTINETIPHLKELGIDVRRSRGQQKQLSQNILQSDNNLTLLIVDQSLSLTVELNNEIKEEKEASEEEDAIALATYSNSDSTVFAYASIFENLWMQTEV